MSDAQRGNQKMLGRHHSEETRRKIADAHTGRKVSEAQRQIMREAWVRRKAASINNNNNIGE
jgi:hypothetical protein